MNLLKCFLIFLVLIYSSHGIPTVKKLVDRDYRLPEVKAKNLKYKITLIPYLNTNDEKAFTFEGEVIISFRIEEQGINKLVMNSKDLKFQKAEIIEFDTVSLVDEDLQHQMITFKLDSKSFVANRDYQLHVIYTGKLQKDNTGFYRTFYKENGKTEWLAATQFQAEYARKVFPCFDEPQYKARFNINIQCPESYNCVSNMEKKTVNNALVSFEESPLMSTYLVAFVVSKFKNVQISNTAEKYFSIFARPEAERMSQYSFDVGLKIVDAMINFTDIDYFTMNHGRNMKMQNAAIPDKGGAMENWGLLTYGEHYLLIDPMESSTKHRSKCATIMAHEIAHMWFGDLVTCDWWSSAWLNEGFASYFQYMITRVVEPGFSLEDQFIVQQLQIALAKDRLKASTALTSEVNSPEEVNAHFAAATYEKGASIIRMISHWIGQSTFQKGLQYHLKNNSYGSVVPEHLYKNLQKAADEDKIDLNGYSVERVMGSWVIQPGHPVVKVKTNDIGVIVSQERFMDEGEDKNDTVYQIPLTYTTSKNADFESTNSKLVLNENSIEFPIEDDEWIVFNIQQIGFYRVHYDEEIYNRLIKVLNTDNKKIHRFNRAQIVDDAFNFASIGLLEYDRMLDIIQYLEYEDDYAPWISAILGFESWRTAFLTFEDFAAKFDNHILKLMNKTIDTLGFQSTVNETQLTKIFRQDIMRMACNLHHIDCVETSINLFNKEYVDPDVRESVYCTALRYGNSTDFNKLWEKFQNSDVANENFVILGALGCTRDQEKINEYLMNTLNPESGIRSQQLMTAFTSALTGNRPNVNTTYTFFINNINSIKEIYGAKTFDGTISSITSRMNYEELEKFKESLDDIMDLTEEDKIKVLKNIEESIIKLEKTEKIKPIIEAWLKLKYNSASQASASIILMVISMIILNL